MWLPDPNARRILFDTFWERAGWRREPSTPADDFAFAKAAGYMFDPVSWSHNQLIDSLRELTASLSPDQVGRSFSDSLTNGRLDLRSALGSYAASRHIPAHSFKSGSAGDAHPSHYSCGICGAAHHYEQVGVNVLSFERFKWGGVRHDWPLYAAFDLGRFKVGSETSPSGDTQVLAKILETARRMPARSTPNALSKAIAPLVKGNSSERSVLLTSLGYAGVLQAPDRPGYFHGLPTSAEHPGGKNDWQYPIVWWRGEHGVNEAAVDLYFPFL